MLPTYIYLAGLISAFLSLLSQTAAGQCKSTVHEIDVSVTSASRGAVISYPPGKQAVGTQKPELLHPPPPQKQMPVCTQNLCEFQLQVSTAVKPSVTELGRGERVASTRFLFICSGRFITRGTSELQIARAPAPQLVQQLFNQET